ncbi:MAG TPA: glycosyltransferase family 1 protein [Ignavibacteriaceae bacterium]
MFIPDPSNTVIINATNIGHKYHGIGVYSLSILKELTKLETKLNFIVYLNRSCEKSIEEINFPENFQLKWISSIISPDNKFKGHLLRLIFSNLISLKYRSYLQFNTSQLEINFFRSNQIVTVHDVIPLLFKKYHKKQHFYFKLILKYGLKNAKYILTPSYHSREMLKNIFALEDHRVKAIHNGANTIRNGNSDVIKEKENFILYIGRINEMKNFRSLLIGFAKVHRKINHNLLVVSDDRKAFENEIRKVQFSGDILSRIVFKENVSEDEKFELMSKAAMLVSPTFYEGFGLPPIEAMACGCPVIVSNTSCIPEVCGSAALYINPNDVNSISEGILELIRNESLRTKLISLGLERVSGFKWEYSAIEHLRVFENVLAYKTFPADRSEFAFPVFPGVVNTADLRN